MISGNMNYIILLFIDWTSLITTFLLNKGLLYSLTYLLFPVLFILCRSKFPSGYHYSSAQGLFFFFNFLQCRSAGSEFFQLLYIWKSLFHFCFWSRFSLSIGWQLFSLSLSSPSSAALDLFFISSMLFLGVSSRFFLLGFVKLLESLGL